MVSQPHYPDIRRAGPAATASAVQPATRTLLACAWRVTTQLKPASPRGELASDLAKDCAAADRRLPSKTLEQFNHSLATLPAS